MDKLVRKRRSLHYRAKSSSAALQTLVEQNKDSHFTCQNEAARNLREGLKFNLNELSTLIREVDEVQEELEFLFEDSALDEELAEADAFRMGVRAPVVIASRMLSDVTSLAAETEGSV